MNINKVQSLYAGNTHISPAKKKQETVQEVKNDSQKQIITKTEKKYFEQLFPHAVEQIRSHKTYTGQGTAQPNAKIGLVFDKKG